ncbi:MAG: hypothetical protein Q8N95_00895, partial [Desulfobacterales bacterium]|nr:hypothetical protein [Desulfobacterales bacterium]
MISGEEILNKAKELAENAERKEGGNGFDTDGDGKSEYDCSGLVLDAMRKVGYPLSKDYSAGNLKESGLFDVV